MDNLTKHFMKSYSYFYMTIFLTSVMQQSRPSPVVYITTGLGQVFCVTDVISVNFHRIHFEFFISLRVTNSSLAINFFQVAFLPGETEMLNFY